ncbi:MAG: hypothetical protein WB384_14625 [Candidatus Sulfotelmatobacter sp.]
MMRVLELVTVLWVIYVVSWVSYLGITTKARTRKAMIRAGLKAGYPAKEIADYLKMKLNGS